MNIQTFENCKEIVKETREIVEETTETKGKKYIPKHQKWKQIRDFGPD